MNRVDTSEFLVHFTKGNNAIKDFASIVNEAKLIGGTGFIKGKHRCVCFTEAPLHALQDIVLHPTGHGFKYKPYGIIVRKPWLFQRGGRPVIYQPETEYSLLPESMRWRHVTYKPDTSPPIDFTWEREWRLSIESLDISPSHCWLVVPSVDALREVCQSHTMADVIPGELVERMDDIFVMDAEFNGRTWTTILLSNPPEGWIGIDVDLE